MVVATAAIVEEEAETPALAIFAAAFGAFTFLGALKSPSERRAEGTEGRREALGGAKEAARTASILRGDRMEKK